MREAPSAKTILLVEDEALIVMNETAILKKHGYAVITAYNAEKAIETAVNREIDLILMDIDLGRGKMDGTEAAEIILQNREVPIVFLTSHSEKEMVEKVKGITRYGYVLKNAGEFVLRESINMAFELFEAHRITKESEEKYRAAFMTSPDAVNINRLDGLYVDINEGFTYLTGYTREDVIGKLSSEIDIWAIPEDRKKLVRGLETEGVMENLESRFRCKNGTITTALMSARLITINNEPHILSVTRDISRRKKAEEEAVKAKAFLDNISDIAYEADAEGNVAYVNPAAEKITGIPVNDLIGKPFLPLFIEQDRPSLMEVYRKTLEGERLENTLTFESGATCHFTTLPKYDTEGSTIVGTFGVARDISEQKRIQEESELRGLLYQQLLDNAGMGIGFWDPEGKLLKINRQAADYMGGKPGDFEGKTMEELYGVTQGRLYLERIKKTLAEQKTLHFGSDKVSLPVGDRWFSSTYNCIYNESGEVLGVEIISNDVTDIKASEANIKALLESSNDVIVFRDREGKAFIYNNAFCKIVEKLFGVEAYPGIRTMDYLPDDQQRFWEKTIERVLSGDRITERFSYTFHDDEIREYELTFNPVYVEGNVIGFSEINRDITDLVANEKALRKSENRFRQMFMQHSAVMLLIDPEKDGKIIDVNEAAEKFYKYPRERFLQLKITDINELPRDHVREQFHRAEKRYRDHFEFPHRLADGSLKNVEVHSSPIYVGDKMLLLSIITDITERKIAEAALKESEEIFKMMFELSPDALLVAESDSGTIVNVNNAAEALFEYPKGRLIGLKITDLHPEDTQVFAQNEFEKGAELLTGTLPPLEIEIVTSQNMKKPVEIRASAFLKEGKTYLFGSFRNISERKAAETQKNIIMEEFNHRIKNNLIMVSSLIQLKNGEIGEDVDLSDLSRQIDAIRMVHERFHRSDDITRINISTYVDDLLNAVFALSPKPVTIESSIEVDYLHSRKAVPLGLIINEIATNAMKHGFTEINDPLFSIKLKKEDPTGSFVLTVSNNGAPFPGEINFDNPDTLGLRLITALVGQLEGSIDLKREPHPVFTIRFPSV